MELILASVLQYRERWMGGFRLVPVQITVLLLVQLQQKGGTQAARVVRKGSSALAAPGPGCRRVLWLELRAAAVVAVFLQKEQEALAQPFGTSVCVAVSSGVRLLVPCFPASFC